MKLTTSLAQLLKEKKIALIVSLPENNWELARAAIESGVDAIKLHVNVEHRASGNHFYSTEAYRTEFHKIRSEFTGPLGIVPGGALESISESEMKELINCGFDYFSIYAHHMPGWMMSIDQMEKTFAISADYSFNILGNVKNMGITALEASIIPGEEYGFPLTFKDALAYQKLVQKVDVPVLVPSQRKLTPSDIPLLYQTGIKAIMLGAIVLGHDTQSIKKAVSSFRKAIDSL